MSIKVMFRDATFEIVEDFWLDVLLEQKIVHAFKRTEEWAIVGIDPLRKTNDNTSYAGDNKRKVRSPRSFGS